MDAVHASGAQFLFMDWPPEFAGETFIFVRQRTSWWMILIKDSIWRIRFPNLQDILAPSHKCTRPLASDPLRQTTL